MLILKGEKVADKVRSYTKKDGTVGKIREIAVNEGGLTNTIVQVPIESKIESDKDGNVSIMGVRNVAKRWNASANRFDFAPITYYVPNDHNS